MRLVTVLLIGSLALSGCTLPFSGDESLAGTFVRTVNFELDNEAMMRIGAAEDASTLLPMVASTSYTYTHAGGTIDTADATVRFTDPEGRAVSAQLSEYTQQASLGRGDAVTVDGVHLTSGIDIEAGDTSIGRHGVRSDWLEALGYPLPIAAIPGDEATWAYDVQLDLDAGADQFGEQGDFAHDAMADFDVDASGTLGFVSRASDAGMDMDLNMLLDGRLSALMEATLQQSNSQVPIGFDLDAEAKLDGSLFLGFGPRGLSNAAAAGSIWSDGTLHVWDEEIPRSQRWEPEFIPHPFIDETYPRTQIPLAMALDAVEAVESVVLFLEDLYAMDLAPGDVFTVQTDIDVFVAAFQSTYEVRVTAQDDKTVPAGTFDTLRLTATQDFSFRYGAQHLSLPVQTSTVWLERETYLPVAAESSLSIELDTGDLEALVQAAEGAGVTVDRPYFTLRAVTTMELQEHAGAPRIAGSMLGAGNALMLPLMGPLAMVGGLPAMAMEPGMPEAPETFFALDDGSDSLHVQRVERSSPWHEFVIETSAPGHVAIDRPATSADAETYWGTQIDGGPMMEGQFLSFCGDEAGTDIAVTVIHGPSAELLYQGTFTTWAAC